MVCYGIFWSGQLRLNGHFILLLLIPTLTIWFSLDVKDEVTQDIKQKLSKAAGTVITNSYQ